MKKILPIIAIFLASILLVSCFSNVQGSSNSTDSASNLVTTESTGESKTSSESEPNEEITSPTSTETEVETTSGSNLEYSEDSSSSDTTENATTEETTGKTEFDDSIFEGLTYVAFGDSITYGVDYAYNYAQMEYPYPRLVAESLELASFENRGSQGVSLCYNDIGLVCMADKIREYNGDADIISVMLGVTDFARSFPLGSIDDMTNGTVYGSLNLIAEHLTTTQPDAFIFFMTPYKYAGYNQRNNNGSGYLLEDVANAVKEVASKYNIPVLDMFNEGQYELEMYNDDSDGLHPSPEFIREYTAPQIVKFIRENYNRFSRLTYTAFGDSITYGADSTRYYAAMDFPYPTLVAESLGLSSATNKGISGATLCTNNLDLVCMTNHILAYTEQANIISVMLGVNDYNRSLPLGDIDDKTTDTVYGSLNLIAEHLTTTQEDAFIFFMTPYKCKIGSHTYKDKNDAGYVLEDVANAVKEVASKYNIPVLDMFNHGQYELEMYNADSDGIHPSQDFIREYTAPQIAEFIRQNYKSSGDSNSNTPSDNVTEETTGKTEFDDSIFEGLTYVAFGDSITHGYYVDTPYPFIVGDLLGCDSVVNWGVGGATLCAHTVEGACITDNILSYNGDADIISVMGGVNDYLQNLPLGDVDDDTNNTIYGSLNIIAENLASRKDVFVFFMTPYKYRIGDHTYQDGNGAGYFISDVADAVKAVAAKYNIPVLDMFNEGGFEREMYNENSDGLHPSQEFFIEYTAPQIAEFIRQNYNAK